MKNIKNAVRWMAAIAFATILAACGGGGGGNGGGGFPIPPVSSDPIGPGNGGEQPVDNGPKTTVTAGVAAVGYPIVGGSVLIRCSSGNSFTAVTDSVGDYAVLNIANTDYPCALRVTGGRANGVENLATFHSISQVGGVVNITPLSDLLVAALAAQDPKNWFDLSTAGGLIGAVTTEKVQEALNKVKATLGRLPGDLSLPDGSDPITTPFKASRGDKLDELLETYKSSLYAAQTTHEGVVSTAYNGEDLIREKGTLTAYSHTYFDPIPVYTSYNTGGRYGMLVVDSLRGSYALTGTRSPGSYLSDFRSDDFAGVFNQLNNGIGQLCVAGQGSVSNTQVGQYAYVSSDLVEVPVTELRGRNFDEVEDCMASGTSTIESDGLYYFRGLDGMLNAPRPNFEAAFGPNGAVDIDGSLVKARAFKSTFFGVTKYTYIITSTKQFNQAGQPVGETFISIGISREVSPT